MKKTLLILTLLGFAVLMQAQGFHFGPRVGMNMATFVEKGNESYNVDKTTKLGFQLGATAEFEVFSFLYIGTTVSIFQSGNKYKDDTFTSKSTFTNIKIPVDIGYKLPIGNVSVFGSVGPYVSVALIGKSRYVYNSDDEFMEEMEETSVYDIEFGENSYNKRLDTGLSISAGVDYRQYQAKINYSFGLRDLTTNYDFGTSYKTTSSILNISLAYFVGRSE